MRLYIISLTLYMLGRYASGIAPKIKLPTPLSLKRTANVKLTGTNKLSDAATARLLQLNVSTSSSVKVVTDIDDTVKSSGGVRLFGIPLGGIDTHFKRGEFYPGVFQFALELSIYNSKEKSPPNVAVLTARAREFLFALALKPKDKLCSAFRQIGIKNGYSEWGVGVETDVYYGSVLEWILQGRKGIRKFNNFEIMIKNDALRGTQGSYVLIGDTGEKDEEAGERIARMYPRRIKAVFLHAVTDSKDRSAYQIPQDKVVNGIPFLYFQTYVGAAVKARNIGLLDNDGVKRVVSQSIVDLEMKEPRHNSSSKWMELERDVSIANKFRKLSSTLQLFRGGWKR